MRGWAILFTIVAMISIAAGIVFRIINFYPLNIQALSYLIFANVLLLLSISFCMLKMIGQKK